MLSCFDMGLVQCGARLRGSPFFAATQRYGAKAYTAYNHTLFPICFDDLEVVVADIFRTFGPAWHQKQAGHLSSVSSR